MGKFIDLTGQKFGHLTVLNKAEERGKYNQIKWICRCDCDEIIFATGSSLLNNKIKSCGCERYKSENLIGQKFGKLTVISSAGKNQYGIYLWNCICDCDVNGDKKVIVCGSNLKNGNTKSCGCIRRKLKKGQAALNSLFSNYKVKAKKKGIIFELDIETFKFLTQKDCIYCGKKPCNISNAPNSKDKYIYTGIDRVDSSKGYIEGNVVPACRQCNQAKSDFTLEEHYTWIEQSYFHQQQNKIEDFCI
jgi:hypothetical protein